MVKNSRIVSWCLFFIFFLPLVSYATLSINEVEQQIKARMNFAPRNKCVGLTLTKLTDGKYSGIVEFENGTKYTLDVTVSGSQVQYTLGQAVVAEKKQSAKSEEQKLAAPPHETELAAAQRQIASLTEQLASCQAKLDSSQEQIATLNKKISSLETALREAKGTNGSATKDGTDTLTVKGFYIGMSIDEAVKLLNDKYIDVLGKPVVYHNYVNPYGNSGYAMLEADSFGKITKIYFQETTVCKLFNVWDMDGKAFAQSFMSNYSIPKLTPFSYSTTWGMKDGWYYTSDKGVKVVVGMDKELIIEKVASSQERKFD